MRIKHREPLLWNNCWPTCIGWRGVNLVFTSSGQQSRSWVMPRVPGCWLYFFVPSQQVNQQGVGTRRIKVVNVANYGESWGDYSAATDKNARKPMNYCHPRVSRQARGANFIQKHFKAKERIDSKEKTASCLNLHELFFYRQSQAYTRTSYKVYIYIYIFFIIIFFILLDS